jgi:hypothetical protein
MKRIFDSVRDKLDEFAQAVEHLSERVQRTEGSISASRARLTGTFKTRAEQEDLRASLLQMTDDLPTLQKKLGRAKVAFVRCKQFIAELPDDAILEPVKVTTNGVDLSEVTRKITAAQDELKALAAVPYLALTSSNASANTCGRWGIPKSPASALANSSM